MRLLALDAATQALSVAVYDSSEPRAARERFEIAPRAHAARLLTMAGRLLDEAGWQLCTIDGLAFGRGPGAFTGLRIAAGFIQGLAYGGKLPVAPVSTLQALAWRALAHHAGDAVRVVQDARMGEVYTADFVRGPNRPKPVSPERVILPGKLTAMRDGKTWLHAGNGWSVVAEAGDGTRPVVCEQWPHALDIARLAVVMLENGEAVTADQALPVYVRDDVARKPG